MDVYNSMLKSRHGRNAISTHYVNLNRHIHLTPFFFGNNQQIRPPGAAPKRKMFLDEPFIRSELEMCMKPNRSPAMKHRRLLTKQKAGCCLPTPACLQSLHFDAPARICQDPQALLKPGWKAVLVSELDSSRFIPIVKRTRHYPLVRRLGPPRPFSKDSFACNVYPQFLQIKHHER